MVKDVHEHAFNPHLHSGLVEVAELDSLSDIGYDRKPFHMKKGRNALMEVD
jgi:hypothetical protein